ncbi:hypothetical protein D3C76_1685870 [compost metagenome]
MLQLGRQRVVGLLGIAQGLGLLTQLCVHYPMLIAQAFLLAVHLDQLLLFDQLRVLQGPQFLV